MMINERAAVRPNPYVCPIEVKQTNGLIDLRHLIAEFGSKFAHFLEQQQLFLAMKIAPDMPRYFHGNAKQLTDLLNNIAYYSLNYIDNGGVVIKITSFPQDNHHHLINISLTTTGAGIPPQMMRMIFQPSGPELERETITFASNLYIAKCVTNILGGDISIHSPMGWGARYEAEINLQSESAEEPYLSAPS